jgi:type III secretion protein J
MTMQRLGRAAKRAAHVALLSALVLVGCSNQVELMSAMPEAESNEVLAALQKAGIAARKIPGKEGMVGVQVDPAQVGRAVDLLRAQGLPRERFAGMGDVFKKEGLISSPLEERARYLYALSQELSATLTQIDGVVVARVHVVLPERASPGEANSVPSTAAVFIKHQEGYNLDTVVPQIRKLVTNSIPGLSPEKVTVVLVSAQAPNGGATKDTTRAAADMASGASAGAASSPSADSVSLTVAAIAGALLSASLIALALLARRLLPGYRNTAQSVE